MKTIISIIILILAIEPSLYAYVDMSDTKAISQSLGLKEQDYIYLMALSGILAGGIMNMFLWKMR